MPLEYLASTDAEALQCGRADYGDAVIEGLVEYFDVPMSCPVNGCIHKQFLAKDREAATQCAESDQGEMGCEVVDACD